MVLCYIFQIRSEMVGGGAVAKLASMLRSSAGQDDIYNETKTTFYIINRVFKWKDIKIKTAVKRKW